MLKFLAMLKKLLLFLLISIIPSLGHADMGLPTIVIFMPYMVLAFIPIIIIETIVIVKMLSMAVKRASLAVLLANSLSTFIGIPVAWLLLFLIQIGSNINVSSNSLPDWIFPFYYVLQAPFLVGRQNEPTITLAMLILLIPFFYLSWKIETWIIYKMNVSLDRKRVSTACFRANQITYLLLAIFPLFDLVMHDLKYYF